MISSICHNIKIFSVGTFQRNNRKLDHAEPKYVHNYTTVKLHWLEHLWNHENMYEAGLVRANECKSWRYVRRHNRGIFSSFFNMIVLCVFLLESPHRGDSNVYTQYTLNYPKSAAMGFFSRDSRTSSEHPW